MKKFLSIALALLMVCVMLPVVALADDGEGGGSTVVAKIGDTAYTSLQDAIDHVADGETIVMQVATHTENGIGIFSTGAHANAYDKSFTIDFNGCVLTVEDPMQGSTGYETQAFHLEGNAAKAITMKNGTITSTKAPMLVQNYRSLNLVNMFLDGSNLPQAYYGSGSNIVPGPTYTLSNNCGDIVISGNTTIKAKTENGIAFDVYGHSRYPSGVSVTLDESFTGSVDTIEFDFNNVSMADKMKLEIKGNGTVKDISVSSKFSTNEKTANISITNGTFSTNVKDYANDSLVVTDGTNYYVGATATATVESATSGTFTIVNGNGNLTIKGGVTIKNDTNEPITVNGKEVSAEGSYTAPTYIVISSDTTPAETPKTDDQKNPATGANDFVGLAAAAAVVALLGSAVVLRKK